MTRYRDEERAGSSMYNVGDMFDDPVVDFETFLENDESIVDEVGFISTISVICGEVKQCFVLISYWVLITQDVAFCNHLSYMLSCAA